VLALVAAFAAAGVAPLPAARASRFRNPIAPLLPREGRGGSVERDSPDPWSFRFRGRYYLANTAGDRVTLRSAATIGGLADARPVRVWPRRGARRPAGFCCDWWAPEFHLLPGSDGPRWYVYWAADDGRIGRHRVLVLESAGRSPFGPYRFRSVLALGARYAIDPTVVVQRGRPYVVFSAGTRDAPVPAHLSIARLANPWTVSGRPLQISSPTAPWEATAGIPIQEGPEALLHGPWLHLVYSASTCLLPTYKLGRLSVPATANLMDPRTWSGAKSAKPVFESFPAGGVWNTGHGSFFASPDGRETWQVYHATDDPAFGCFRGFRTTRAQPISWTPEGTPDLGTPIPLRTDLVAPSGDPTFERQLEDAPVVASRGASHRTVADATLVGERGLLVSARRPGGLVTVRVALPPGRFRLLLRAATGPRAGRVRISVSGSRRSPAAQNHVADAYSARADVRELDFGVMSLRAQRHTVRLTIATRDRRSHANAVLGDELNLLPAP